MIILKSYVSPLGELRLGSLGDRLCLCDWVNQHHERVVRLLAKSLGQELKEGTSAVIDRAAALLDRYFAGERVVFDVPLLFGGTEFQKTVWRELLTIPYGMTVSYSYVARRIGRPSSVRAVANAVGANPISVIVPCHRVVGSNGSLTGYSGGIGVKRGLLALETGL